MKINNPVDCLRLFADEIQQEQEGLWCVSLRPNGQIRELAKASDPSESGRWQLLCRMGPTAAMGQWLFVRICKDNFIFDEMDWNWLDQITDFTHFYDLEVCDYVKICRDSYSSLIAYENKLRTITPTSPEMVFSF